MQSAAVAERVQKCGEIRARAKQQRTRARIEARAAVAAKEVKGRRAAVSKDLKAHVSEAADGATNRATTVSEALCRQGHPFCIGAAALRAVA